VKGSVASLNVRVSLSYMVVRAKVFVATRVVVTSLWNATRVTVATEGVTLMLARTLATLVEGNEPLLDFVLGFAHGKAFRAEAFCENTTPCF
jgi:hypothetical protein